MHIHLDLVGGIAGDMFAGAMLDLRPDLAAGTLNAIRDAGLEPFVGVSVNPYTDGVLSGHKFDVDLPEPTEHSEHHHHQHQHQHQHHHHVHWSKLRQSLSESRLDENTRNRAVSIFQGLAEAEARVHDKPVDDVTFHEVGAWDSIADIVAAAFLIEQQGPCSWSIGKIPIGSGRVKTQHGLLPVPAPATVLLLEGYACFDDGLPGERVTPTGAAIVKHLSPAPSIGINSRVLRRTGYGFGTKQFDGLSNVVRVLQFEEAESNHLPTDRVAAIHFEVDDQTPEDLAVGLEHIRASEDVLDVVQSAVMAKGGRHATHIQVLAKPEKLNSVSELCFRETTTIGVRVQHCDRIILKRRESTSGTGANVKVVARPGGETAKADISSFADVEGHANRDALRRQASGDVLMTKILQDMEE